MGSLLIPLMATVCALVKDSHWFVSRPNLYRFEVGLIVLAVGHVRTENGSFINILPSVLASKHIINFLSLKIKFVLELLIDSENVRTCFAKESEIRNGLLC